MTSKKYIHIGFGKTGTSKLQTDIFPQLCNYLNLEYWGDEYKHNETIDYQQHKSKLYEKN